METTRTTSLAELANVYNSQHVIPAQKQQATRQIPRPGNTTAESMPPPADVALSARTPSIPANAACATPLLNIVIAGSIVNQRLRQLVVAMKQSNLPASEQTINQLQSAIKNAKVAGKICEVNQVWVDCFQRVSGNPDNPTIRHLVDGLESCDSKEQALDALRSAINSIELDADQSIRDLFLVDLIAHLMTIGVYIALFDQEEVFSQEIVDQLEKALTCHDRTKVFKEDGTTVNTENLKGYMLLPIVYGALSKNPDIKKHGISIIDEVRPGKSLADTCIAAPICSHVQSESHHPEYHIHRNQPMPDIDIYEFMVDGLAAGTRPDRFEAEARFSPAFTFSLKLWRERLGSPEKKAIFTPSWAALSNAETVFQTTQQMVGKLEEIIGDVKLAHYFGQPVP